eukprot:m.326230 g.326230  ORF g.326230 m.326230 type:complete len:73 (+) comp16020_c0_seq5:1125-1343(+)
MGEEGGSTQNCVLWLVPSWLDQMPEVHSESHSTMTKMRSLDSSKALPTAGLLMINQCTTNRSEQEPRCTPSL